MDRPRVFKDGTSNCKGYINRKSIPKKVHKPSPQQQSKTEFGKSETPGRYCDVAIYDRDVRKVHIIGEDIGTPTACT
jgi:hypothetical protein